MYKHSKLAPSSAARRVACPGSRALEEKYPQSETAKSREGDAAHWVASEMLRGKTINLNDSAHNGETITQEMIDGAQIYHECILKEAMDAPLHIEEMVSIKTIHPDCYGTPDCWFIRNNIIHIYDYKFGHSPVDVIDNYQLMEYAAGIYELVGNNGFNIHFQLTIIQPRAIHSDGIIRRHEISVNDINHFWNQLIDAEELAAQEVAPCIPNPECRYCSARAACTALQTASFSTIDFTQNNSSRELTHSELGNELRILEHYAKLLNARITGLQEQALALIQNGESIPHYTLDYTKPRQQWSRSMDEIVQLGELFNINILKPLELITPLQAVDKGLPKELLEEYVTRPLGSPKLIPYSEKKVKNLFKQD